MVCVECISIFCKISKVKNRCNVFIHSNADKFRNVLASELFTEISLAYFDVEYKHFIIISCYTLLLKMTTLFHF